MGVTFPEKNGYITRECYTTFFAEVLVDKFILTNKISNFVIIRCLSLSVSLAVWHIIASYMSKYVIVE